MWQVIRGEKYLILHINKKKIRVKDPCQGIETHEKRILRRGLDAVIINYLDPRF